jgi:ATPase family associated with various cellular activities (AAA)
MTADLAGPLDRLDRILARAVDRMTTTHDEARGDLFRGLYISEGEALQWSRGPRATPLLGVAAEEPALVNVIDADSPLAALARAHGLSSFDLELLVIALAPEVDVRYGRLYAFLQDDVSRTVPEVDLALTLLCPTAESKIARREHFASDAPLLRDELLSLISGPGGERSSLLSQGLKLDDAVIRRVLGIGGLHSRLRRSCTLLDPTAANDGAVDAALAGLVADAHRRGEPLTLYLSGRSARAKREAAHALAATAHAPLLCMDVEAAFDGPGDQGLIGVLLRDASLHDAVVYLDPIDQLRESGPVARRLLEALSGHGGASLLGGTRPDPPAGLEGMLHAAFELPDRVARRDRWADALAGAAITVDEETVDDLAARFRLTPDQITDAVAVARNVARIDDRPVRRGDLFAAARTRTDVAPSGLARKIDPIHDWDDLVLPEDTAAQLQEMCQQIVERPRVLDAWGFGHRHARGRGVSALFAGPSGTGKTTAAEIIARELGLDLLKIDLSGVVSKYIGETEKNLQRVFAAAENANAILFFDEADALFGKRSEVRDSHDRYANIEIAYLLERMEDYDGVAILATNLRQNVDDAFVRRLSFVVEFPFPTDDERVRIWELQFPAEAEREPEIDFEALAREFRITGGSIRNIVQAAAYLAAGDGRPIATPHLLHATRREYQKLGRVLPAVELEPAP